MPPNLTKFADDYAIQPGKVWLRHVKLNPPGMAARPGQVVTSTGQAFYPLDRRGVNGKGGFTQGHYDPTLNQEGGFSVAFPNDAGDDGQMHRDRFSVVKQGRPTPGPGGVITYQGGMYRPGDEWIEIYLGDPGELLFVGTPTSATLTDSLLTINGFDGQWLLKKTRETAAGFWNHAPRDAFEYYTQAWQGVVADTFVPPSSGGNQFTYSTSQQTTPDGKWVYTACETDAVARPGFVRLRPAGLGTTASIQSRAGMTIGTTVYDSNQAWRVEASFRRSALSPSSGYANGASIVIKFLDTPSSWASLELYFDSAVVRTYAGVAYAQYVKMSSVPPGPFRVTFEGRGRWIYIYLDGSLLTVIPTPASSAVAAQFQVTAQDAVVGGIPPTVDVDYLIFRRTYPLLNASATVKGDYRLPGAPPVGGLTGRFWDDHDLQAYFGGRYPSYVFAPAFMQSVRKPYVQRNDAQLAFTYQNQWTPPGPANGEYFSARWEGAVFLALGSYDYRLRCWSDDRATVWVGKTRIGEQIIGDWTDAGHGMVLPATIGKDVSTYLRSRLGQVSGWYPIIVEYSNGPGSGTLVLEYERSDQPGVWNVLGVNGYAHLVRAAFPAGYWPLSEPTGATFYDESGAGNSFAFTTGASGSVGLAGPFDGSIAALMGGTGYAQLASGSVLDPGGQTAITLEAWAYPTTTTGIQEILRKDTATVPHLLRTNAAAWEFALVVGGTLYLISGGTVTPNAWHHVVGTFDGTTMTLYVNGTAVASATHPGALSAATGGAWQLGRYSGNGEFFSGRLAHPAIYFGNNSLSAAQVAAHYQALTQDPGGNPALSPYGILDDDIRFDSHYDAGKKILDSFGYQTRLEPMQLESGEFPGRLVPRVRVGRDTAYVLEPTAAVVQTDLNAEDVCDALLVEAQGLGDQNGQTTLDAEVLNFAQIGQHMLVHQEFESLADISVLSLLLQRASNLLALRGSPWEQIQATAQGHERIVDSFPLTGALAKFAWIVGDGLRVRQPRVGIVDVAPRQILGLVWPFVPDGRGTPAATFKQRPRDFAQTMRELTKQVLRGKRNYQGQLVVVTGSLGANTTVAPDAYSRVALPATLTDVVKATLVVQTKTDGSAWAIEVNGAQRFQVATAGRYDVTPFVAKLPGEQRMYARLLSLGAGSTGIWDIAFELLVKT